MATTKLTNESPTQIDKMTEKKVLDAKDAAAIKRETLMLRKIELEKRLNEKYNQLQILSEQESQILGVIHSTDVIGLRRKGTSFKLQDNLIKNNGKEDEINKLLLEKQLQHQISDASLKLANDGSQTQKTRRTHKQSFEVAQQKLQLINQNLSILQKRQLLEKNEAVKKMTQDDLNLLYKNQQCHNENYNGFLERHNSMKSSTSSNSVMLSQQQSSPSPSSSLSMPSLKAAAAYQRTNYNRSEHVEPRTARTRHDSIVLSPNLSHKQMPHSYYPQQQQPIHHQQHVMTTKMVKLKKSHSMMDKNMLTLQNCQQMHNVDSNKMYPDNGFVQATEQFYRDYYLMQLQQYSPRNHHPPPPPPTQPQHSPHGQYFFDHRSENVKTPTSPQHYHLQASPTMIHYQPPANMMIPKDSPTKLNQYQVLSGVAVQQGLGGYWMTTENNERIWCAVDNRFASLDRKSQQLKPSLQNGRTTSSPQQPTKSTSLGNFDFLNIKTDEHDPDTLSIGSENKKREKVWCETSLDTGYLDVSENRAPAIPAKNFHYQQQQLHNQQQHHQQPRSSSLKQIPPNIIHDSRAYNNNNNNNNTYHHPVEMHPMSPSMSNKMKPISVNVSYGAATSMLSSDQMLRNLPATVNDPQINFNVQNIQLNSEKHTKLTYHSPIPTNSSKTHSSTEIQMESPVNMTVVEQGKIIMPYKEVTKPFEMSDFYKYSTKYRQKQGSNNTMPALARQNANNQSIEDNNNGYQ